MVIPFEEKTQTAINLQRKIENRLYLGNAFLLSCHIVEYAEEDENRLKCELDIHDSRIHIVYNLEYWGLQGHGRYCNFKANSQFLLSEPEQSQISDSAQNSSYNSQNFIAQSYSIFYENTYQETKMSSLNFPPFQRKLL